MIYTANTKSSRDEKLVVPSNRSFGMVATLFFAVIAFIPLLSGRNVRLWALSLMFLIGAVTVIKPVLLSGMNILWNRFGLLLHKLTNPIILAVLFFAVLAPFGMIMRVFRKDALNLIFDPQAQSYWILPDSQEKAVQSMINQF